jgi:hypothetical protein
MMRAMRLQSFQKFLELNSTDTFDDRYEKIFSLRFENGCESGLEQRDLGGQLGGGPNHGHHCGSGPLTIDTAKKERWYFKSDLDPQSVKLKVGERVTVHYEIGGRKMYVTKIEKAGKADKGSKKN